MTTIQELEMEKRRIEKMLAEKRQQQEIEREIEAAYKHVSRLRSAKTISAIGLIAEDIKNRYSTQNTGSVKKSGKSGRKFGVGIVWHQNERIAYLAYAIHGFSVDDICAAFKAARAENIRNGEKPLRKTVLTSQRDVEWRLAEFEKHGKHLKPIPSSVSEIFDNGTFQRLVDAGKAVEHE